MNTRTTRPVNTRTTRTNRKRVQNPNWTKVIKMTGFLWR